MSKDELILLLCLIDTWPDEDWHTYPARELSLWYVIGIDKDGPGYEEIDSLISSLFGSNCSGGLPAEYLIQKLKENEANPA